MIAVGERAALSFPAGIGESRREGHTLAIKWADQHDFQALLKRSEIEDKPVLLDLHSPECSGCTGHDRSIYSDPEIARDVMEYTLPVRVVTTNPDRASTEIINNHIFIWSPTVQLVAPDQTRYHEWNGAPRRTRLSVGYQSVFHDTAGHLTPESFRAQLLVGRGKASLRKKKYGEAIRLFDEAIARHPHDRVTVEEAERWRKVARESGTIETSWDMRQQVTTSPLAAAVERFAQTVAALPDSVLMKDWIGKPGPGDWQWYSDCLREVVLQGYQELCDFAIVAERERAKHGPEFNDTHRLLGQHRFAYREFQSLFVGVPDSLLDKTPLRSERSIRENLAHVIMAEWWAYRPQILHALDRGRAGLSPEVVLYHRHRCRARRAAGKPREPARAPRPVRAPSPAEHPGLLGYHRERTGHQVRLVGTRSGRAAVPPQAVHLAPAGPRRLDRQDPRRLRPPPHGQPPFRVTPVQRSGHGRSGAHRCRRLHVGPCGRSHGHDQRAC